MEFIVELVVHVIATLAVAGSFLYRSVSAQDTVAKILNGVASILVFFLFMHAIAGVEVLFIAWVVSLVVFYVLWGKTAKQEP